MANIIRVTPEELTSASSRFQQTGNEVRTMTRNLTQTVGQLSGRVWSGEAATAYKNKFNGLQDDIERLYKLIIDESNALKQIAQEFKTREAENTAESGSLSSDVI